MYIFMYKRSRCTPWLLLTYRDICMYLHIETYVCICMYVETARKWKVADAISSRLCITSLSILYHIVYTEEHIQRTSLSIFYNIHSRLLTARKWQTQWLLRLPRSHMYHNEPYESWVCHFLTCIVW